MSVSLKLKRAIDLAAAMGHDRAIIPKDNPVAKCWSPKAIPCQCRVCLGAGINKVDGGSCDRCRGTGVEKLSIKAIRRQQKRSLAYSVEQELQKEIQGQEVKA
jgi:hypothetical protein